MDVEREEYLARGKRGIAYTGFLDGRKVLVKEHNPAAEVNTIRNEALMLRELNERGVGPRFIAYEGGRLVREFVDGERIEDFLEHATIAEAKAVVRQVLEQCRAMDLLGVNKLEMTRPYKHILVRRVKSGVEAVMIDFERCKRTEKPKNVTQACQYIARLQPLLSVAGVDVDAERVKGLGARYKRQGYDEKAFKELKGLFR
ncbi:hypothetical protein JXA12_05150 [Candidatus Woesearchaeota archaeon]|nr:hypothetical protein [Candidatus Woesearchaeota archaeon]